MRERGLPQHKFQCLFKGHKFSDVEIAERLEAADTIFQMMTPICNENGYALARHGTAVRDVDLIAVPWTADAVGHTALVLQICSRLIYTMGKFAYDKPHGRASFAMWWPEYPDLQIDLSIVPAIRALSAGIEVREVTILPELRKP